MRRYIFTITLSLLPIILAFSFAGVLGHFVFGQENPASDIIKKAEQNLENTTDPDFPPNPMTRTSETSTYGGPYLGIAVQYPSSWSIGKYLTKDDADCGILCRVSFEAPSDRVGRIVPISIEAYDLSDSSIQKDCHCNTLKEFVRYSYGSDPVLGIAEVISDKPVALPGNHSAWEMESQFNNRKFYSLWTTNDDTGYLISLVADRGQEYDKYLKEVKEMIGTLVFTTTVKTSPPKIPSFMK